jgi:putative copper export protein
MLTVSWDTIRLTLHVLAATIWVGGQLTLAALVPALRRAGPELPRVVARQFSRVAWPAFGVLVLTGIWNVAAESDHNHGRYRVTLMVKIAVVLLSGVAALLHARARRPAALAVWGAVTGVTALAAVFLGVLLAG